MLARLQKLITLGAVVLTLLILWSFWRQGYAVLGFVVAALFLSAYALILGVEFSLLRIVHGNDPTPRASGKQLLRAWWGEVCSAPAVFCWRQPFFSRRWPDLLPAEAHTTTNSAPRSTAAAEPDLSKRRGVLLVHGFLCNRGIWNRWLQRLHTQRIPFVAVNLEPVFGSIDEHINTLDTAVADLFRTTGLAPVAVVHSMGGLVLRRWYAQQTDAARLHHVVTIGTPHQGTWLARLALTHNARQMQQQSEWLRTLAAGEVQQRAQHFTCFYSHCDNIVFPPASATLAGADNRHLQGLAHVQMVDAPEPWAELMRRLA